MLEPYDNPIRIQTVVDSVVQRIETAIIRGELTAGTKISEARLAKSLGVSRAPVREALRRLEGKKLIERKPHIGARVFSPSREDILAVLIVREALEGMVARLVTENASDAELAKLEIALQRQGTNQPASSERAYLQDTDFDFHYRLAQATRNPKLIELLCGELYAVIRVYRYRSSLTPGRVREAHDEHREILSAIRDRDPDRAEALMRRHIALARQNVQREGEVDGIVRPAA